MANDNLNLFRESRFTPDPNYVEPPEERDDDPLAFVATPEPVAETPTAAPVEVAAEATGPHVNKRTGQVSLLGDLDQFTRQREEWEGMPEYVQEDMEPWKSLTVHFENRADMEAFSKLIGQRVLETTKSLWYPEAEIGRMVTKRYVDES